MALYGTYRIIVGALSAACMFITVAVSTVVGTAATSPASFFSRLEIGWPWALSSIDEIRAQALFRADVPAPVLASPTLNRDLRAAYIRVALEYDRRSHGRLG